MVVAVRISLKRAVSYDIERQNQAFQLIDKMYCQWEKSELWDILPTRVKYGIGEELVELCKLKGIGGKRASKMYNKGIESLKDVADLENKKILYSLFKPTIVKEMMKEAKELINQEK